MERQIRIVVPAYNAMATLPSCIKALKSFSSSPLVELVVVDDGLNCGVDQLARDCQVKLIRSLSCSASKARNAGASGFTDGIIIFVDADVVLRDRSLESLVHPIVSGIADAAIGNYHFDGNDHGFIANYKQLYTSTRYLSREGPVYSEFWTAIGAVDASTFHKLAGFNPSFRGAVGEDTDFGIRLTLGGFRIVGVPSAIGIHTHPLSLLGVIKNDWKKARATLALHAAAKVSLTNNSHSKATQILAVFAAVILLSLAFCVSIIGYMPVALALTVYIGLQSKLLRCCSKLGASFLLKSLLLTIVLDMLRAASVVHFLLTRALKRTLSHENRGNVHAKSA